MDDDDTRAVSPSNRGNLRQQKLEAEVLLYWVFFFKMVLIIVAKNVL